MYAVSVMIDVVPEHAQEFKAAAQAHARNTRSNESGCVAFSVFQSASRPDRFYLHEVYVNKAAVEEVHNKAPYLAEHQRLTRDWVRDKRIECWENDD